MSRRLYPHNRARYWYAYDLDEVCSLFADLGLHIQTVRKWVKDGLKTIDGGKPALIYGNDLIGYLKRQNNKNKCKTAFDQMYCFKCQDARPIIKGKVTIEKKENFLMVCGQCRTCKIKMFKNYKMDDYQKIRRSFDVVGVLELYDGEKSTDKTHIPAPVQSNRSESLMRDLFDG